jgi:choline dehydrogenase-like flavoprotein
MPQYDYLIVGGGSAGSVVAHRLSNCANKVLHCEAGQDTPPGNEPSEIADSYSCTAYFDPLFHWTELEGFTSDQVMTDDEALEAFVRKAAIGVWHASFTAWAAPTIRCRWSIPRAASRAQSLRVVDASVFPVAPCANTNFPTLMTAEKIAGQ